MTSVGKSKNKTAILLQPLEYCLYQGSNMTLSRFNWWLYLVVSKTVSVVEEWALTLALPVDNDIDIVVHRH